MILPVKRLTQYFAELDKKKLALPDKHNKFCCRNCGCMYGDMNCPVLAGNSPQLKKCKCNKGSGNEPVTK